MNGSGEREGNGRGQAAKKPFPRSSLPSLHVKSGDFTTGDTWHSNGTPTTATKNFHPPPPPPLPFFVAAVEGDGGGRCAFPNYDFQSERESISELGRERPEWRESLLID